MCKKDKGTILYENADEHLSEFLDIQTLFVRYEEIDMLKNFLFDTKQKKLFEILAKLYNIKQFFSEITGEKDIFEYEQKDMSDLIDSIKEMKSRGTQIDIKILDHFSKVFNK
jgi:hypothetical protein